MSDWSKNSDGKLHKVYEFKNYRESFAFTSQVVMLAEKSNHHPSIILNYDKVEILLISHDVNAVTERDTKLAGLIDKIVNI
jgi:4a-hydroxytetrahydrobiopterin dehydratase